MDIFGQIVEKIINEQEKIIGPLALEQANHVNGLKINWSKHEVEFQGEKKEIVENLIEKYSDLFGKASVEVCREAVSSIITQIPQDQRPSLLR